jgi:hypothetical protein
MLMKLIVDECEGANKGKDTDEVKDLMLMLMRVKAVVKVRLLTKVKAFIKMLM